MPNDKFAKINRTPDWDRVPLGKAPDTELARQYKVPIHDLRRERKARGIPSFKSNRKRRTNVVYDVLADGPQRAGSVLALARRQGVVFTQEQVDKILAILVKRGFVVVTQSGRWLKYGQHPDMSLHEGKGGRWLKVIEDDHEALWNALSYTEWVTGTAVARILGVRSANTVTGGVRWLVDRGYVTRQDTGSGVAYLRVEGRDYIEDLTKTDGNLENLLT